MQISLRPDLFENNKVDIKISCDGAKYTRLSNYCLLSFMILTGEKDLSSNSELFVQYIVIILHHNNNVTGNGIIFSSMLAL